MLPDRSAAVTTDWQKVRLQEIVTDESREDGRMPRTIECELTDDLVDKCIPGDEVIRVLALQKHNHDRLFSLTPTSALFPSKPMVQLLHRRSLCQAW